MATSARRPRKVDLEFAARMRRFDLIGTLTARAIPWLGIVAIMFFAWKISQALAGRFTIAQIALGLLADVKTSSGIAKGALFLFGASGTGFGLQQRRLRRLDIERRSDYIRQLEEKVDPKRTSSRLTKRGTTPPGE